ncbi:MAG TPA: phospho-N-acetylmuramoyl-pentapeptide-transferase, partial [Gemmatimonadaceae bacterium]
MLYYIFVPLVRDFTVLNVFNYITFRAAGAAVTSLLLAFLIGPWVVRQLHANALNQVVRDGTPDSHKAKSETPTMGGLIILLCAIPSVILWTRLNSKYSWIALAVTVGMGAIGFLDDTLKLRQKRRGEKNEGLVERYKLA